MCLVGIILFSMEHIACLFIYFNGAQRILKNSSIMIHSVDREHIMKCHVVATLLLPKISRLHYDNGFHASYFLMREATPARVNEVTEHFKIFRYIIYFSCVCTYKAKCNFISIRRFSLAGVFERWYHMFIMKPVNRLSFYMPDTLSARWHYRRRLKSQQAWAASGVYWARRRNSVKRTARRDSKYLAWWIFDTDDKCHASPHRLI